MPFRHVLRIMRLYSARFIFVCNIKYLATKKYYKVAALLDF